LKIYIINYPEIKDYSYDFGRNTIVDRRGRSIDTAGLGLGAVSPRGRASRAGTTALRQGVLIQSLASSESGKRPELLEQFLRGSVQLAQSPGLSGIFSRSRAAETPQVPDTTQSRRRPQVKENIFGEPVLSNWTAPEVTNKDRATRYLQDKMVDARRVVQAIEQKIGKLDDQVDPYLKEELFYGKVATKNKDFLRRELKPLLEDMAKRNINSDCQRLQIQIRMS
jgi:hypothetical protein